MIWNRRVVTQEPNEQGIIKNIIHTWFFVDIVDTYYNDGRVIRGNCLSIKTPFGAKLHWLQMYIISFGFRRFPKLTGGKGYLHNPVS